MLLSVVRVAKTACFPQLMSSFFVTRRKVSTSYDTLGRIKTRPGQSWEFKNPHSAIGVRNLGIPNVEFTQTLDMIGHPIIHFWRMNHGSKLWGGVPEVRHRSSNIADMGGCITCINSLELCRHHRRIDLEMFRCHTFWYEQNYASLQVVSRWILDELKFARVL